MSVTKAQGRPGEEAPLAGPVPELRVEGISKAFGPVRANVDVSFSVRRATIHAVVGENGAGKTTLMRIIYGLYRPDAGTLELGGQPVVFDSPRDALRKGVGMVHQHSLLVKEFTVVDNVLLTLSGGRRPGRREVAERLRRLSDANGLHVDPWTTVGTMSVGARQRTEILAALYHGARLMILDEPTTVLTPQEADRLFDVLAGLRAQGSTLLLVTHKLREVMRVSDEVTVLRRGRVVAQVSTSATDEQELVRMMIGKDVPLEVTRPQAQTATAGSPRLEVRRLCVLDREGVARVQDVSFDVYPGEIVAVTGVEGNGQTELTHALMGLWRPSSGEVRLEGEPVTDWSVDRRRRAGIGYIPEDRMHLGINLLASVRDNLTLGRHRDPPLARRGVRNLRAVDAFVERALAEYQVVAPSAQSPADTLSGGNLQKLLVAREVLRSPRLLIAAQPTQGVDVAAAHFIRSTLVELARQGTSILLVSSDLAEVANLADRAVVLYNGRVSGTLVRAELSETAIGRLAMGLAREEASP